MRYTFKIFGSGKEFESWQIDKPTSKLIEKGYDLRSLEYESFSKLYHEFGTVLSTSTIKIYQDSDNIVDVQCNKIPYEIKSKRNYKDYLLELENGLVLYTEDYKDSRMIAYMNLDEFQLNSLSLNVVDINGILLINGIEYSGQKVKISEKYLLNSIDINYEYVSSI